MSEIMDIPPEITVEYKPHDPKAAKAEGCIELIFMLPHHSLTKFATIGWRASTGAGRNLRGFDSDRTRVPRSRLGNAFGQRGNNHFGGPGPVSANGDIGTSNQRSYTWGTRSWVSSKGITPFNDRRKT